MPYCKLFFFFFLLLVHNYAENGVLFKILDLFPSLKAVVQAKNQIHELTNAILQAELRKSRSQRRGLVGSERHMFKCEPHTSPDPSEDHHCSLLYVLTKDGVTHLWLLLTVLQSCPHQWGSTNQDSDPSSTFSVFLLTFSRYLCCLSLMVTQQGGHCRHNSPDHFVGELKCFVSNQRTVLGCCWD